MYPMLRLISSDSEATSKPATVAFPEDGLRSPHRIRIVVDFPAPLGPRKPKISPWATSTETRSTATKSPNRLVRSCMLTAGPFASGGMRHLFLHHQGNEYIFERRRDGMILERLDRRQLLGRRDVGVEKQVQIGAGRQYGQDARLLFQDFAGLAKIG